MPPPETHKTLTAPRRTCSSGGSPPGPSYAAALGLRAAERTAVPPVKHAPGPQPDRRLRPRASSRRRRSRPSPEADRRTLAPPAQSRPDRPAADAGGGARVPRTTPTREPTRSRSTGCSRRRTTASGWPSPGSTSSASPTPSASTATRTRTSSPTATTSSTPSTRNKPFDQFTIEQLAGDLLPNADRRAAVGHRLQPPEHDDPRGRRPAEGVPGQVRRRPRADRRRLTWLGSTMGCCECHDHKFDPFTTQGLLLARRVLRRRQAVGRLRGLRLHAEPRPEGVEQRLPVPAGDRGRQPVPRPAGGEAAEANRRGRRHAARSPLDDAAVPATGAPTADDAGREPDGWVVPHGPNRPRRPRRREDRATTKLRRSIGGAGQRRPTGKKEKPAEPRSRRRSRSSPPGWSRPCGWSCCPTTTHDGRCFRGADGRRSDCPRASSRRPAARRCRCAFRRADADARVAAIPDGPAVIGVLGGWKTDPKHARKPQRRLAARRRSQLNEGDELIVKLTADSARPGAAGDLAVAPTLDDAATRLGDCADRWTRPTAGPADEPLLAVAYLLGTGCDTDAYAQVKALERDVLECRGGKTLGRLVTEAWKPAVDPRAAARQLAGRERGGRRPGRAALPAAAGDAERPPADAARPGEVDRRQGQPADRPVVRQPALEAVLRHRPERRRRRPRRPGRAADRTPSCSTGWRVEFRDSGWDVKHVVKLIVMSDTYRQDSRLRPELKDVDPHNRLLA